MGRCSTGLIGRRKPAVRRQILLFSSATGELIAAFVFIMAGMALHPVPTDLMALTGGVEALP